MNVTTSFKTPVGWLNVTYNPQGILKSLFSQAPLHLEFHGESHASIINAEIQAYFQNQNHLFSLQLLPAGTAFQQRVCQALISIPSGQTLTYGELARRLHSSPRAVGQACKRNPIALFIPCHRVVAQTGLGGFMGNVEHAKNIKMQLLHHESGHHNAEMA